MKPNRKNLLLASSAVIDSSVNSTKLKCAVAAVAITALLSAQSASAANFFWDSTPTPADPGFGTAAGIWSSNSLTTGNGRWTTSATGIVSGSASQVTANTDTFNYGDGTTGLATGSITIGGTSGGPINVGSITFGAASGTITLSGGFLAFGTSKAITVNNTTNTISSVIQGSNGFTKNGTGTLILTGNLTHTGLTTVANGGTLVLSGNNSSMSGGVSLSTAGTGANAPKLNINSATAIGTGTLAFGGGGATDTVQIDNTNVGGAITLSTNNAITLSRNFTFVGTQSLNLGTGTATIGGLGAGPGTRNITVTANTLTFGGIVAENVAGLGINKLGNGTLVLANTNSYTGTTTITAGTLQLDGSTHASSTVAVGTSGTLTGTGTVNGNATLTGSGIINKSSGTIAGTLGVTGGNWNGSGAVTGLVTSSSGTFTIGNGANLTANGDLAVTGGTIAAGNATSTITGSVNYTSGSNSTFAGIIAGSGKTVTLNNAAATLTLSGANTYTGATNVNAGALIIGSTNALGTTAGNTVVASGSQVYLVSALTVGEAFNIAGNGTAPGNGAIQFGGGASGRNISGAVTLSGAATIKTDGSTGSTLSGGIDNAGNALTFVVDGNATSTVSTTGISGGGSLTKASTGTLNLNAASTYGGGTFITDGIISVATSATALGSGDVTFNGGTRLAVAAGLNVANNIIIGSNTGITGRGLLESSGTGTATLSGAITINATPAAGGTFAASTGNNLVVSGPITASVPLSQRTGTVTFSGGGTGYSALNSNTGITKVGALNGIATSATVTINSAAGAASLDLNGFNQSLVGISRGSASFTSIIGNSSTATDSTLTTTGTSSFAGVIQDKDALGAGTRKVALTVNGGTLTLSGSNTYTGATLVSAGTLLVNGQLGDTAVTVNTTAVIGGSGAIDGSLHFADGAMLTVNLADPLSIIGPVTFDGFGFADLINFDVETVLPGTYTLLAGSMFNLANVEHVGESNALVRGDGKLAYFQNGSLQVVVIPEPSTVLLGALGTLLLLRRRR